MLLFFIKRVNINFFEIQTTVHFYHIYLALHNSVTRLGLPEGPFYKILLE